MKGNAVLQSEDRNLFGVTILQEAKTGFLSLTKLQEAYDIQRIKEGWSKKEISHIFNRDKNKERIYYILREQGFIELCFRRFMEIAESKGIAKYLKELGVYKNTGRGENSNISCNPYLWMLVAMELNPMLYARVVKWLGDGLLLNRLEAGDMYIELSDNIKTFIVPTLSDNGKRFIFSNVAKLINKHIFGKHEKGVRDKASKLDMLSIVRIETKVSALIECGKLTNYDEIKTYINNL